MILRVNKVHLVEEYFYIRIWAAPATLGLFAMMGWFFGMQNAIFPLIITVFVNLVNILLSYFFVKILNWEVAGVAWGTVIAQYAGIILSFILFYGKHKTHLSQFSQKSMLQIDALKQYLTINRDIFIRTFCLTFAFGFFSDERKQSFRFSFCTELWLHHWYKNKTHFCLKIKHVK